MGARRRPTFTGGQPPTIIGAEELNFRVRHGNGCDLFAVATGLCGPPENPQERTMDIVLCLRKKFKRFFGLFYDFFSFLFRAFAPQTLLSPISTTVPPSAVCRLAYHEAGEEQAAATCWPREAAQPH